MEDAGLQGPGLLWFGVATLSGTRQLDGDALLV